MFLPPLTGLRSPLVFYPKFSQLLFFFHCHSCQNQFLHSCCCSDLKTRVYQKVLPSPGPVCLGYIQILFLFPLQHFQICIFLTVNSSEMFPLLPGLFNSYISSFQPPPKTARRGLLTLCKRLYLVLVLRDSHLCAKGLCLSGGMLHAKVCTWHN